MRAGAADHEQEQDPIARGIVAVLTRNASAEPWMRIFAKGIAEATMLRVSTSSATNAVNRTLVNTPIAEGMEHATTAKEVVSSVEH